MVIVVSFEHVFEYGSACYTVLFEGKTQTGPHIITRWVLTIYDHPKNGLVKYVLEKEAGLWERVLRINGLSTLEENALMSWAMREIMQAREEER